MAHEDYKKEILARDLDKNADLEKHEKEIAARNDVVS